MPRSPSSANPSAPKETDQQSATPEELNLESLAGVAAFHLRLAAEASQQAFNRQIEAIGPSVPYRTGHYTVLRLIAGFEQVDGGSITIGDRLVSDRKSVV